MKLFMLYRDTYACSAVVDVDFGGKKVIAKDCFSPDDLPQVHDKVQCLIKNGKTLRFEGCVRKSGKDLTISIHTPLVTEGVDKVIENLKLKVIFVSW